MHGGRSYRHGRGAPPAPSQPGTAPWQASGTTRSLLLLLLIAWLATPAGAAGEWPFGGGAGGAAGARRVGRSAFKEACLGRLAKALRKAESGKGTPTLLVQLGEDKSGWAQKMKKWVARDAHDTGWASSACRRSAERA